MSTLARRRHHRASEIDRDSWQNILLEVDTLCSNDQVDSLIAKFGCHEKETRFKDAESGGNGHGVKVLDL